ncbi:unnamed protein product [Closterium sp. NIES-54]
MVRSDSILSFLPMPLAFSSPLSSPLPPPPPSPLPACIPSSSFQGAFRGRSPMGANVSHAAAAPSAPPPPPIAPAGVPPPPAGPVGLQQVVPPADAAGNVEKPQEKVDYLNLPCPVKYEEIQREALSKHSLARMKRTIDVGYSDKDTADRSRSVRSDQTRSRRMSPCGIDRDYSDTCCQLPSWKGSRAHPRLECVIRLLTRYAWDWDYEFGSALSTSVFFSAQSFHSSPSACISTPFPLLVAFRSSPPLPPSHSVLRPPPPPPPRRRRRRKRINSPRLFSNPPLSSLLLPSHLHFSPLLPIHPHSSLLAALPGAPSPLHPRFSPHSPPCFPRSSPAGTHATPSLPPLSFSFDLSSSSPPFFPFPSSTLLVPLSPPLPPSPLAPPFRTSVLVPFALPAPPYRPSRAVSLKPDLFEGLRFDFNKPLNQSFSLSHSVLMGSAEVPSQSGGILKVPHSSYEFGANVLDAKKMLIGRMADGRLSARVSYQVTDSVALKVNAQIVNEPHFSQGMFQLDYKGSDYQWQAQAGNNAFYGVNYIQSVTPTLSLGGEAFWLGHQRRSGLGIAGRYNTDKVVATAQVASTGVVSMTYVQRVSDKVALAADFLHNWNSKESATSVGYDYILRQCRLRGRLDTNGCVAAYLEERLNLGVNLLFSAEVDHWKKDYKFGFGMSVGE